jgi:serine/threonine-protein kinase
LTDTFGPYQITKRLGAGGMAEVFIALRRGPAGFEQEVCLKRILSAYADDEAFQKMFLTEARIAARVRHANIVQVYDFGEVGGTYYLALELVEGTDLRHLLQDLGKEKLEIPLVAWIAHQTLSALACVHGAEDEGKPLGLVHRDLSPSNVLISRHGEVKLADFGVAKATKAAATASGAIKGKPSYMPVEQLELDADPRSDLFALGVMMYEMLTGVRPFDGPTEIATMQRVMRGAFTPVRELAPHAPESLAKVVERLLARDRNERYQTAEEVLDAIVEHVPPPTARRKLGALVRRSHPDDAPTPPRPAAAREDPATTTEVEPADIEPARASGPVPGAEAVDLGPTMSLPDERPRSLSLVVAIGAVIALLAIGGIVAGVAMTSGDDPPVAPDAGAIAARDAGTDAGVDSGRDAGTDAGAADAGTRDAGVDAGRDEGGEAAEDLAVLTVNARPYGFVWINGNRVGQAPVTRRLRAGTYTVAAGASRPVSSRTVNLRPGERESIVFTVPAE